MRRLFHFLLACAILLLLPACGGEQNTQHPTSEAVISECSDEVSRAISYGLVPEEIRENYDAGITFRQYSQMLTNLVGLWDENRLGEWTEIIALAAESDEEMLREDGILATSYAMILMGKNSPEDFFHLDIDAVMAQLDSNGDSPTWDYPLFPGWEETGFEWCNSNYLWGGLTTCAVLISRVSGQAIYPYDFAGKSAHLQDPLTREEAICAVLRLGETDPAILEPEGVYVQLVDVGTYDKSIITDELLNANSGLPEVTQAHLPSDWKGAGLSSSKNDGSGAGCTDFRETDIKFLADNGFNFARIFFGFSTPRFPDYPEDGRLVNENELRDLDQLIAWGIEYGVHIQIAMSYFLDESGNEKMDGSIAANDAQWAMVQDYWTMLTRRYAGISSKFLTFDLSNEVQPREGDDFDYATEQLEALVTSLRAADPHRVLLYSCDLNWVETTASLGLAVGCHAYYPKYIATTGYEYAEQNPYAEPTWPQTWFPMGMVQDGFVPLVIQGDLSGAELSIHVDGLDGTEILVQANGEFVETLVISGSALAEGGNAYYQGLLPTLILPQGTTEVKLQVSEGGYAMMDTILVRSTVGEVVMVPHDTMDYPDRSKPLPLIVRDDGTYTNSEGRMVDSNVIYQAAVKPYADIAAQYGVGFMVNEFGVFGNNVNWDIDVVAAYHDTVLQMLTEQDIGWCYCELYNPVPKHLTLMPAGGITEFQWGNTSEEAVTVICESGEMWEYLLNRELMDVFRKYIIDVSK